ncbi:hypothetical protein EDD21DRAFT_369851 [Dissophora ornata]|nr:hypothetical protein EDD21DRAFT_369851 [Dissophora ornata]
MDSASAQSACPAFSCLAIDSCRACCLTITMYCCAFTLANNLSKLLLSVCQDRVAFSPVTCVIWMFGGPATVSSANDGSKRIQRSKSPLLLQPTLRGLNRQCALEGWLLFEEHLLSDTTTQANNSYIRPIYGWGLLELSPNGGRVACHCSSALPAFCGP